MENLVKGPAYLPVQTEPHATANFGPKIVPHICCPRSREIYPDF